MAKFLQKIGCLVLLLHVCLQCRFALALDPEVRTFQHTAWNTDQGLGAVFDIQQSVGGYLWLTTSTGVFRFDGVHFQTVEEATKGAVEGREIHSVFTSANGGVWFKTRAAGLLLWRDGRLTSFPDRRCTPARREGIAEDPDGSLWLQGTSGLFHLRGSTCEQIGQTQGYPGGFPAAILVDHNGTVWVRTLAGALLFLPHSKLRFQQLPYVAGSTSAFVQATSTHSSFLHEAPNGAIWLSDDRGLRRVTDAAGNPLSSSKPSGPSHTHIQFGDFAIAPDRTLWAATNKGVLRFNNIDHWKTVEAAEEMSGESFTAPQGVSSNAVWKVLIDREGSVWVGTNSGLDRFRRTPLSSLVFSETQEHDFAILAGEQGSVWTGNEGLSLTRVAASGVISTFGRVRGTICLRRDREGAIWSAGGTDHRLLRSSGSRLTSISYPEGMMGPVLSLAFDHNDELWVSTATGGAYHLSHGAWLNQNAALGKRPGVLGAMTSDDQGNVWFGFSNKLVRWDGSAFQRFSFPDGTRGVSETTLFAGGDHVWLAGTGGVELFSKGHFSLMRWSDPELPDRFSGIVETRAGDLWMNGFSGVTHISAEELAKWLKDPRYAVRAEHLGALDGLAGFSAERVPEPSVVESSDGRIWFATTMGIAWLDPALLANNRNRLPPPVEIASVTANGKTYTGSNSLDLPKHTNSLRIDYTALSVAIPERVLFRYKLDGVDVDWQDAGTRRQAFYNSLSPGRYRFHVIACNNDGVWNTVGASLSFSIIPAFYQTDWFKLTFALAVGILLWWMIRRHIRNITRQLQVRLADRLAERERIARELHDTLLQSLFGLTLHFQAAADRLSPEDPVREALTEALTQSDTVMREGRQRIRDLRSGRTDVADLADGLIEYGHQLQTIHSAQFQVFVEGRPRPLDLLLQQEILMIAREAIVNAFRHADAMTIIVIVSYRSAALHISIRDDGRGIAEGVLRTGRRHDHWGLPGMNERARKMRGKLQVERRLEGGTHVHLQIPGIIVYRTDPGREKILRNSIRWLRKQTRRPALD